MAKDRLKGDLNAFMGPGSELEGTLSFRGSVRLDGKATGRIQSQGLLIIGPGGQIQADIDVETVIICGQVKGEVKATKRIEIRPPAKVYGTLTAPVLVIHEGVIFEGTCQMTEQIKEPSEGGKVAFLAAEAPPAAS